MWVFFLLCLGTCLAYCENFEIVSHSDRGTVKGSYIDPNAWPKDEKLAGESQAMESPYGVELLRTESCPKRGSLDKTVSDYLTVRRFINLLLKRAHFEDSEGNTVLLDSISSDKDGKLVMSLEMYASQEELNILLKFGQKKPNLSAREIDEVITNIFSSKTPLRRKCQNSLWNWMNSIGNALDDVTRKIDFISVMYFVIVMYIIWSINITLRRQGSWKMLFMCFALPAIAWEFSKVYEEETIKHLSEQLRHEKIPDHCYGIDKREWWERLWNKRSDVDCYEHHLRKMSHPVLKISILKVALSQVQLILDVLVKFLRDITDLAPGEWFFNRWANKGIIWASLTVAVVVIGTVFVVIHFGGIISLPFFSIKKDRSSVNPGSRVQPIGPVDEVREPIKPPPRRRKKSGKRSAVVDRTDGKTILSIEHNISGDTLNLNALKNRKERNTDSDSGEEKEDCLLSKSHSDKSLSLEAKDKVVSREHESEESSVGENGSESGNSVEVDSLGGGDAPSPTSRL